MSRSGYSDDCEGWSLICWRGAVESAIRGKRGQAFLREMRDALDALPVKRLIAYELESGGEVCAIGAVGKARGMPMQDIDPHNRDQVGPAFGIAPAMAAEIEYMNDEVWMSNETPEQRYERMRKWVEENIR